MQSFRPATPVVGRLLNQIIMGKNIKFGEALEALKNGKRISRSEWGDDKKFVFMQIPSVINKAIVPKMQSLPDAVKSYFESTFQDEYQQIESICYANQLAIVGKSNLIEGYNPSAADVLAEDWIIIDC